MFCQFLSEVFVFADLEGLYQVRLQAVGLPDAALTSLTPISAAIVRNPRMKTAACCAIGV
jgi:hypothetical protein